jgi:O-antigen ligase
MSGLSIFQRNVRERLSWLADILVVVVAASLPWSTSATAILAVLWVLVLVPTLDLGDLKRQVGTAAGGLPALLVALGVAGMLWADVSFTERWNGIDSFVKLLAVPLLLVQFHRSDRARCVFMAYLGSCTLLLVSSTVIELFHPFSLALRPFPNEVLVKNAATQSGEFVTCIFGLLYLAYDAMDRRRWAWLLAFVFVICGMLANMLFVATGRTALVVGAVLLAIFAVKKRDGRTIAILACAVVLAAAGWLSSSYLQSRVVDFFKDLQLYQAAETVTSSGERLVFWTKSIDFIREAPLVGHGTGSIRSQFEKSAFGQTGAAAEAAANPHNQTLAVGIQLGFVGMAILWAMWISHLMLFRGNSLIAWIGLVIVVQNVVGSLFNSHLFDFLQGWTYVVGVGVAGGTVRKVIAAKSGDSNR